jgi:hypothetical protein
MAEPSTNSPAESQFRKGFLGLLETLRFSIVLLHNELVKHTQANTPNDPEKTANSFELVYGKNNFINRIEQLKHDVAYQPAINRVAMAKLIDHFNTIKTDLLTVLDTKLADESRHNPILFFTPTKNTGVVDVLQKSLEQIKQNTIEISGTTLQIRSASIPEEVNANRLSSGTNLSAAKRL